MARKEYEMKDPSSSSDRSFVENMMANWQTVVYSVWSFLVTPVLGLTYANYLSASVFDLDKGMLEAFWYDKLMAHYFFNATVLSILGMILFGAVMELYEAWKRRLAKRDNAAVITGRIDGLSPRQASQVKRELTRVMRSQPS
jgi:hypothetical protein